VEGEAGRMNPPTRKEEESLLSRFTGFLRGEGPEEDEQREPEVLFKDPVAELPRRAPPPPDPGMIIPLRRGNGCAGGPAAPPEGKEEQPPQT
jgi:hypothetical protein